MLAKLDTRDEFPEGGYTTYMPWYDEYEKKRVTESKREGTKLSRSQLLKRLLTALGARDEYPEEPYPTFMPDDTWEMYFTDVYDIKK